MNCIFVGNRNSVLLLLLLNELTAIIIDIAVLVSVRPAGPQHEFKLMLKLCMYEGIERNHHR